MSTSSNGDYLKLREELFSVHNYFKNTTFLVIVNSSDLSLLPRIFIWQKYKPDERKPGVQR